MDYYIDIKLLQDPEFSEPQLMSALFSKLHRALVEVSQNDLGISFPYFSKKALGNTMRLHGSQVRLTQLEGLPWRRGLGDFTEVTEVLKAPQTDSGYLVKRIHAQSNVERLRRRAIKRQGISHEQAVEQIPDSVEEYIQGLPFVRIKSQSTGGQQFRLYIQQTEVQSHNGDAPRFSKYGLSQVSTVPKF